MSVLKNKKRSSPFRSWCVVVVATLCMSACKQEIGQVKSTVEENHPETFQELGFFGPVKSGEWERFLDAVQNNIAHSRDEPGNLSFSLYQPEGDTLQPIWFERFKTKEAHNLHKEKDYFKNAIDVIKKSLVGQAYAIELKELKEVPALAHAEQDFKTAYTSITLFDVRPENRKDFILEMAIAIPAYRASDGNSEYNLYQYKDDANKFVLIEAWEDKMSYDDALKQRTTATDRRWFAAYPVRRDMKDLSR
ncbi:MAG: hypothetical protein DI539_11500 [Flavobacterium psychrophilum]|nr:MAG: hypothetical protein DI539_11500 [Flavobacterium psychrophilum]